MMRFLCRLLTSFLLLLSFYPTWVSASSDDQFASNLIEQAKRYPLISKRIDVISQQLLGRLYFEGSLGDGAESLYDQFPLYRFDRFDCQTFVETVLALSNAQSVPQFQSTLQQLRYQNGRINFIFRHHFVASDWINYNSRLHYLRDITDQVAANDIHYVQTYLNKKKWFSALPLARIRLLFQTAALIKQRLAALRHYAQQVDNQHARLAYIPLQNLLDSSEQKNNYAKLHKIPNGAIIFIIRPNWEAAKAVKARILVSHMGFAIWRGDTLYFRHASAVRQHVTDELMINYLMSYLRDRELYTSGISVFMPEEQSVLHAFDNNDNENEKENG